MEFEVQYCMENKFGFLARFLASGIFLDRFFGDFWRISGALFGGFLEDFATFFLGFFE